MRRPTLSLLQRALLVSSLGTSAHAAGVPTLQEVAVTARQHELIGVADSASEGTVTAAQLRNRPLLRPAEALETVPGMIVTQHSGDGKANQYFLRGFNLDHGSDFATHVMGMPVNMASHAHGQGYMDLNFLMPELIQGIAYRKGVYAAEDGDFATTGSARIDYRRRLEHPFAQVGLGQNGYRRLLAAGSQALGGDGDGRQLLVATELMGYDGPWTQPENLQRRQESVILGRAPAEVSRARWGRGHLSPTEREYDRATAQDKERLIYVLGNTDEGRDARMTALVRKEAASEPDCGSVRQ